MWDTNVDTYQPTLKKSKFESNNYKIWLTCSAQTSTADASPSHVPIPGNFSLDKIYSYQPPYGLPTPRLESTTWRTYS